MLYDLIAALNSDNSIGGTLSPGTRVSVLAFADALVIMEDREEAAASILRLIHHYFADRGMQLNVSKCNIISARRINCHKRHNHKIDDIPLTAINIDPFTYLGHEVAATGYCKPSLRNLQTWLKHLTTACLKSHQKLEILRFHLIPRLFYGLQCPKVDGQTLSAADRMIRASVKKMLHLNIHTPDAAINDGGLRITELRHAIPQIFTKRLQSLIECTNNDNMLP